VERVIEGAKPIVRVFPGRWALFDNSLFLFSIFWVWKKQTAKIVVNHQLLPETAGPAKARDKEQLNQLVILSAFLVKSNNL